MSGNGKFLKILAAAAIAVACSSSFIGCGNNGGGGNPSDLAGNWVRVRGAAKGKPENIELFNDASGVLDKSGIAWKVENKRLILLSAADATSCGYKISGDELTLTYDDASGAVFVKKEKLEEYLAKKAEARAKTLAVSIKQLQRQFVLVNGGTFAMAGDTAHNVTVSGFYICKYEVTQDLWDAVTGENPSRFIGSGGLPVENVSWNDAQEFIRKLNSITNKKYRLPTEAEWEFAARGGNKSKGCEYGGSNNLSDVAWYDGNSGGKTHPVGKKSPNELRIYDMSGNVWEWVSDLYDDYGGSVHTVRSSYGIRGGGWNAYAWNCRVDYRSGRLPSFRRNYLGLRLAFDAD